MNDIILLAQRVSITSKAEKIETTLKVKVRRLLEQDCLYDVRDQEGTIDMNRMNLKSATSFKYLRSMTQSLNKLKISRCLSDNTILNRLRNEYKRVIESNRSIK